MIPEWVLPYSKYNLGILNMTWRHILKQIRVTIETIFTVLGSLYSSELQVLSIRVSFRYNIPI